MNSIADDALRVGAADRRLLVEQTSVSLATDRGIDLHDQRFAAVVVDDVEHPQLSPVGQRVRRASIAKKG